MILDGVEYEFNNKMFKELYFLKAQNFKENSPNGESLHKFIQEQYGFSASAIKSWRRDRNPEDIEKVKDLAEALEVDFRTLIKIKEPKPMKNVEEGYTNMPVNDFTKEQIYNLYSLMVTSIDDYFVTLEDTKYWELMNELRLYKVSIPGPIYSKIYDFIEKEIITFFETDLDNLISSLPVSDDENDIETIRERNGIFFSAEEDKMQRIEEFGDTFIRPLLTR